MAKKLDISNLSGYCVIHEDGTVTMSMEDFKELVKRAARYAVECARAEWEKELNP